VGTWHDVDARVVDRRTLICLVRFDDGAALVLDHGVIVEKGCRFWADRKHVQLVIQRVDGSVRTVPGRIDDRVPGPDC
jgi:hypothetical protein